MRQPLKIFLYVLGAGLGVLLLVQLVGSPLATRFANRRLAEMPQFAGRVDSVGLHLWRGTISARDLVLTDRAHPEDGPVVTVAYATISLSWAPFFRGRIGGDMTFDRALVVMVKRAETAQDEVEEAKKLSKPLVRAWQDVLATEFPIEFRKIVVKDSRVRFDDRTDPQVVSLWFDRIDLTLTGFSNREESDDPLPARLQMNARIAESGNLTVKARADPADSQPRFEATLEVEGLSLLKMHDFLARYALIDVQSGEFELYSEVNAAGGAYDGYTKPFFKDLVFEAVPDADKSLIHRAAIKVAAVVQGALKNEQGDIATKAPFYGDFEDNEVELWTTLENLLRNAFIQALREGFEDQPPGGPSGQE